MAWEWSFTEEGIGNIRENINGLSKADLLVILGEWRAYNIEQKNENRSDSKQLKVTYKPFKKDEKLAQDTLARMVVENAEEFRTCDNGGFDAWVCPYGCHTVSLDLENEEK